MITTVTLNAAIDKTCIIPDFHKSGLFRVEQMVFDAGGKGINVARVISLIGGKVTSTGFVAGMQGRAIIDCLSSQNIPHDFVTAEGESRLCLTILDPNSQEDQTELLEAGPVISSELFAAIKLKVADLAKHSSIVVLSGSLPRGCPADTYRQLVSIVQENGAKAVLDSSGDALVEGVKAMPYLIKPNEHEIGKLLGHTPTSEAETISAVRELMKRGIHAVVVSLGSKGALAGWDGKLYRVTPPTIEAINPVGSGDAMVAGLVTALERGETALTALQLGAACGTANALQLRAGIVDVDDLNRLLDQVSVELIN